MRARAFVLVAIFVAGGALLAGKASQPVVGGQYFKGNLHTHTLNSDGDSTPDDVVRWYREHNYNFVTLTDHNYLTSVDGLNALHGADEKFLVMRGEELTDRFGNKPIHINGLNPVSAIQTTGGSSVVDMVQKMIDAIRAAGGVPSVNHPNYGWAISADELAQLQRTRLFEVFNGHPLVNNIGGGGAHSEVGFMLSRADALTASPSMHTRGRRTRPCPGRGRVGSTCDRRGWNRARSSRRSSAAISIRPQASSCNR
jgi:hypothetical protein